MTKYRGRFQCPRCGKDGGLQEYDADNVPDLKCGDCLMTSVEIVTLEAVSVREVRR